MMTEGEETEIGSVTLPGYVHDPSTHEYSEDGIVDGSHDETTGRGIEVVPHDANEVVELCVYAPVVQESADGSHAA